MNIKHLFIATVIVAAMSATAMAEGTPSAATGKDNKAQQEKPFAERKAELLKRLADRSTNVQKKMQEKQTCVQAATTDEAVKACFPDMGKHRRHGKRGADDESESQ